MKRYLVWNLVTGNEYIEKVESIEVLEERYEWQRCATDVHRDGSVAFTERDTKANFIYRVEENKI